MPVICALIPRFQLSSALSGGREDLRGPVALAPEPGAAQLIGEVSGPAEALGVRAGMRIGEALSRCPELVMVPPDPERAVSDWDEALRRLEGIGAQVESERAGEVFFEARGLRALWGGTGGVMARARAELGAAARMGAAPGRFCAYAAARRCRARERPPVIEPDGVARYLSPLSVSLLCGRLGSGRGGAGPSATERASGRGVADDLPNELERLGINTLGKLARLPREAVADRFGQLGLLALDLALGTDHPLCPREPSEGLAVELELPEAASGPQLERALELLIARLLSHPARLGRSLRSLRISARLAAGGGWRREVAMRRASADPKLLIIALSPHILSLPAPAAVLRLEAVALGRPAGEQLTMAEPEQARHQQISEAVRQVRAAEGPDALLRVLELDPGSRLPERRAVLMPYPEDGV